MHQLFTLSWPGAPHCEPGAQPGAPNRVPGSPGTVLAMHLSVGFLGHHAAGIRCSEAAKSRQFVDVPISIVQHI